MEEMIPLKLCPPSSPDTSVSIVFPIRNEGHTLERLLARSIKSFSDLELDWELILVNDGSTDLSASICNHFAAQFPQVRAVHHPKNLGYGAALRSGFEAAKQPLVFFTDSDGQFDLGEVGKLLPHVRDCEIVVGYRASRRDPWHRKLNSSVGNFLARLFFGLKVRDINCAFKIFRRDFLQQIAIQSDGALVNTEILAKARRMGAKIHEVPVSHFPRLHGTPTGANPKVIAKTFWELFRLWRKLR